MSHESNRYADLNSPLGRWEPRCKLLALTLLIFSLSLVRDLRLLPVMLAVSAAFYKASGLPAGFLLARMKLPAPFILVMAVTLPFFSGQTILWNLGPLTLTREGCLETLIITTKFISIFTLGLVLFNPASLFTTLKSMRALGLPLLMADMAFFFLRYLKDLGASLKTMERAMGMRGLENRGFGRMRCYASLVGSLLVRSYEQSDRVYKSMVLRGYGEASTFKGEYIIRPSDVAGLMMVSLLALLLALTEMFLR